MLGTSFDFVVERCNSSLPNPMLEGESCNDNLAIDKWIQDVQIDTWGYSNSINFNKYETKPVFRS